MINHIKKYKEWYIFGAVVFLITGLVYWFSREDKDDIKQKEISSDSEPINEPLYDWESSNDNFPLKFGSYGPKVKILQNWIQKVGNKKLTHGADGKFGKETETALVAFKQRNNVSEDYWKKLGLDKLA